MIAFHRLSIRNKLLVMVLVPLWVVLPLLGLILLVYSNEAVDRLLITKVRSDLAVAHGYFERVLAEVGGSTRAVAESAALLQQLHGPADELVALLQQLRQRERLDFINVRAPDGRLQATDSGSASGFDPLSPAYRNSVGGVDHTRVEVLQPAQLNLLAPQLRARVPVPLVPTRNAAPSERQHEDRALVLLSSHSVRDAKGQVLAQVQGGVLLNRNLAFIDHVNQIVYPDGALPYGSRGTATLFLDDVRISTNVRLFGPASEERAIGTRVSQTVRDHVLGAGHTWLDRAFVVNDWYVSAYQPLSDGAGRRVGMLYVGFLEAPFTRVKVAGLLGIGLLFFGVMIAAAWVSLRWARHIFGPLEQMEATLQRVQAGDLHARVGAVASGDEIGRLAGHLDGLLASVDNNTHELKRWNAELDAKVAERTQALRDTQAHLVRNEKLAAVGQLTAGVAHEINNPIAVVQGNLDLLRELLGPQAQPAAAELALIDEQLERMRLIVTQLLQFARPTEFAAYVDLVLPAAVIDDSLVLVGHLLARTQITLQRSVHSVRRVAINRQELQQVLVNLLINALHAMPAGGTLALAVRDVGDEVWIELADTGPGLPPALQAQLFQPFVTQKKDGTGLGLWISRSLVERYGGDITGANRSDGVTGAVFTVRLLADEPASAPSR